MVLKVCFLDQEHQCYLGARQRFRLSGLAPDLLNQKFFTGISDFIGTPGMDPNPVGTVSLEQEEVRTQTHRGKIV